ncbi:MAG: tetratricopeptide repeat protein [Bradymonadia bacterium]
MVGCVDHQRKPDAVSLSIQQDLREVMSAQKSLTSRIQMIAERISLLEDRMAVQEANIRVPLPELPVVKLIPKATISDEPEKNEQPSAAITQADVGPIVAPIAVPAPVSVPKQKAALPSRVRKLAARRKTAQPSDVSADPSTVLSKGTRLVNRKKYTSAVNLMQRFRANHRGSELVEYAFLIEGRAYFEQGNAAKAIEIFGHLIEAFPNGVTVPDALYMVGLSQDRLGHTSRAVETLARLKTIYPATEAGKRAAEALSGRSQSL